MIPTTFEVKVFWICLFPLSGCFGCNCAEIESKTKMALSKDSIFEKVKFFFVKFDILYNDNRFIFIEVSRKFFGPTSFLLCESINTQIRGLKVWFKWENFKKRNPTIKIPCKFSHTILTVFFCTKNTKKKYEKNFRAVRYKQMDSLSAS